MTGLIIVSVGALLAAIGYFAFALSSVQQMLQERQDTENRLVESERHLQSIIDNTTAIIAVTDLEGRFVLVNQAFERAFGISRIEILGLTAAQLFSPEVVTALADRDSQVVDSPKPIEYDLEIPLADGARFYLASKFALRNSAGRPYAVCAALTDITERKRLEEERSRIFNLSLDLMCVTTFDGYAKISNPQFTKIFGWSEEEMKNRPFFELVHPDDLPATIRAVQRLEHGESIVDFENRGRCKDGSYKWMSWRVSPDTEKGLMIAVARPIAGPSGSAVERSHGGDSDGTVADEDGHGERSGKVVDLRSTKRGGDGR